MLESFLVFISLCFSCSPHFLKPLCRRCHSLQTKSWLKMTHLQGMHTWPLFPIRCHSSQASRRYGNTEVSEAIVTLFAALRSSYIICTTESMKVFFLYTYAACLCNAYLPFYRYKPYLSSNECLSYIPSFLRGVFFFFFSVCIAQSFFTSLEHKHFLYENVNCSVVLFVYSHFW